MTWPRLLGVDGFKVTFNDEAPGREQREGHRWLLSSNNKTDVIRGFVSRTPGRVRAGGIHLAYLLYS